jgi:hypothetical protein
MREALPVAGELEVQRQRGQRVDPAKAAQPGDGRPPLLIERQPRQALGQGGLASRQAVDGGDLIGERKLTAGVLELLARQPRAVRDRPRRGLRIDTAVTQQLLETR